jgi:glycosyltransferase involved in cell wall biosynthesis
MKKTGTVPISVYVITKNEIRRIERALASVAGWADEIVVVDSGSDDGTLDVVRKFTDRVYHRDFEGFGQQYAYAHGLTKNAWVMYIDGDEEVSPGLRDEIIGLFKDGDPCADGYTAPRETFYLGRWIKHGGWYPDYIHRIYRRSKGTWEKGLHPKLNIDGKMGRLRQPFLHYNYRDISHQIMTVDRYSTIASRERVDHGKGTSPANLLLNPPFRFFRDYFLRRGFLDGMPGFIIAVTTAYYVFVKYAKTWEIVKSNRDARLR